MKRFTLVSMVFLLAVSAVAEEYTIGEISGYENTYKSEQKIRLKYDDKEKQYYLQLSNLLHLSWIYISPEQLETMRATVDKAVEWGKIVESKNVEVAKEIPNSQLNSKVAWRFSTGGDFYSANNLTLKWMFAGNEGVWALVLMSSEVSSLQNHFMTYSTDSVVIAGSKVKEFKEIISKKYIEKAKADHDKAKKESDDLFQ